MIFGLRRRPAAITHIGDTNRRCILLIDDARDTADEAVRLYELLHEAPAALVTSASHLPRAVALCAAQRLHVVPCPTDFLGTTPRPWRWSDLAWDVPSLERTTVAAHERLGLWWARLRRQT